MDYGGYGYGRKRGYDDMRGGYGGGGMGGMGGMGFGGMDGGFGGFGGYQTHTSRDRLHNPQVMHLCTNKT